MTAHRGNTILLCSSQQLPRLHLGPLKGFLSRHGALQGALDSPCALLPEVQIYKDTVRCAALGAEVPGTPSRTTDANLDFAFVESALLFMVPNIGRA